MMLVFCINENHIGTPAIRTVMMSYKGLHLFFSTYTRKVCALSSKYSIVVLFFLSPSVFRDVFLYYIDIILIDSINSMILLILS